MQRFTCLCLCIFSAMFPLTSGAQITTLALDRTIDLPDVNGRIDHLAVDLDGQRLFVAELGNDSVDVIDLKSNVVRQRIAGLKEPQGVGYLPSTHTLYVANGGDGSLRWFEGDLRRSSGTLKLGADADNIRIDANGKRILVGYGEGAIAIIDALTNTKVREIALDGHPESFQLASSGEAVYVNVPDAKQWMIGDAEKGRVREKIPTRDLRANFPMALDEARGRLMIAFRDPSRLRMISLERKSEKDVEICRDADDVFIDRARHRLYVICGQGVVDVLDDDGSHIERVATAPGARTGLFVPALDRLYVAAPARSGTNARVLVWKPEQTPLPGR
ncbi:MAG: YncE family protein [Povalibacter sp.]